MTPRTALLIPFLAVGCASDTKSDADTGSAVNGTAGPIELVESAGPEIPDAATCDEDYSFCGYLVTPPDFEGTTRSLAIALYTSIPPAGPPNAILAEIPAPSMGPNEMYPVRLAPMIETGEYYIWANLYMDGGGEWAPVNDVDYTGSTAAPVSLLGESFAFEDITLEIASGW